MARRATDTRSDLVASPLVVGLVATGIGVAVASVVHGALALEPEFIALLLALPLGLAAGALAYLRFSWLVLALLATRSSFDVFDVGGTQGGALDPAAAVGLLFSLTAVLWLVAQYRVDIWVRPSAATKALYLLAAAGVASAVSSADRAATLEASARIAAGALMFGVLEQMLYQRPRLARRLLAVLVASLIVPAGLAFGQAITQSEASVAGPGRVVGTFVHPNPFATFLVMLFLLATALRSVLPERLRLAAFAVATTTGVLLVLTYTRVGWIAAVVGMLYLAIRHDRRLLGWLAGALVVVVLAAPSALDRVSDLSAERPVPTAPANSLDWRFQYWGEILPLANENPLTGIGLESVQRRTDEQRQPHNVFVQAYVEMGLFGLASLAAVIATMASHLAGRHKAAVGPMERALSRAAIAISLAFLVQLLSENLLTQTIAYWYAAAAMTYGLQGGSLAAEEEQLTPARTGVPDRA